MMARTSSIITKCLVEIEQRTFLRYCRHLLADFDEVIAFLGDKNLFRTHGTDLKTVARGRHNCHMNARFFKF